MLKKKTTKRVVTSRAIKRNESDYHNGICLGGHFNWEEGKDSNKEGDIRGQEGDIRGLGKEEGGGRERTKDVWKNRKIYFMFT